MDKKKLHTDVRPSGVDRPRSEKGHRQPAPDDPYQKDPGAGSEEDERVDEGKEADVRKEEGVGMKAARATSRDVRRTHELAEEDVVIGDEDILPSGIQTGQTARGSYSTDTSTGAGRYGDHRAGVFGVDDVAQPGNDEDVEPDPIDTKINR
jgi:hypothetical protein